MSGAASGRDHEPEYADAARYDAEYGELDEDGAFFLEHASRCGTHVLDLGCGTGRLAIPLARAGKAVTGIDRSPAMLARAKAKAGALPIRWVEGDFRDCDLGRRFDLAIAAAHAFQALLSEQDQRAFLACARRHLSPGGVMVFDTRNPAPVHLAASAQETHSHDFIGPDGVTVRVFESQVYETDTGLMHYGIRRRPVDGRPEERTRLTIKFTAPDALRARLIESGFAIEALYGDHRGAPFGETSPEIVVVARAVLAPVKP